jgi:glycosyltransferase involved in cell wall biosynthesis
MGARMRILLATNQLPPDGVGGVGLFTLHLAGELRRAGCDVVLLAGSERRAPGRARLEELPPASEGVRTVGLRLAERRGRAGRSGGGGLAAALLDPAADRLCGRLLEEVRPDVLHIQHLLDLAPRLATLGRRAGAVVVATVHDFWPICQRIDLRRPDGHPCPGPAGGLRCATCLPEVERGGPTLSRLAARARRAALVAARLLPYVLRTQLVQGAYDRAHHLTCPSASCADLLVRSGFDPLRITLVDYGIPPLPLAVAAAPRPATPLRLGYLGTLGPHKGLPVALDAIELLGREGGARLFVHGGPLRDERLARRLDSGGDGAVLHAGPYRELDLPGILAGLDALVVPSLWPETGPMVLMEAFSAGIPVLASRIGAMPERVSDGRNGLLFAPGDPPALARAIRRLVDDYPAFRREALATPVRTVSDAAQELLALYARVLAEHRPGAGAR